MWDLPRLLERWCLPGDLERDLRGVLTPLGVTDDPGILPIKSAFT